MKIRSINPANGMLLKEFQAAGMQDVTASVKRARKAQGQWATLSLEDKESHFRRLSQILQNKTQKILRTLKEETGKRIPDGEGELFDVIDAIDYYFKKIRDVHPDTSVCLNSTTFPDTDVVVDYVPYGVVGLIMPWNFPFYSPMMFIIASLVSGNSVVLKPSEYSTLVGLMIKEVFDEASFPSGLVEIVVGGEETGKLLVKSDVDKIFFVGSVEAGKDIITNAGIKPVQVELGGNSAAIVLESADLNLAVQGVAWAATYHAGQDCAGIKRVFVVESVAKDFLRQLVDVVKALRPDIDYGPYITPDAMYQVKNRIDDAIRNGGKLLCGGEVVSSSMSGGNWLTPSVILLENQDVQLVAEETFGNTVPVMIVPDTEAAIREANDTTYGLSNCIFSKDLSVARSLAAKLESGMVFINEPFVAFPGWDHWTGWKNSGFGTVESKLMQCLKKKVISINKQGQKRLFWYPYKQSDQ